MGKTREIYKTSIFVTICTVIPLIAANRLLFYLQNIKPEHAYFILLPVGLFLLVVLAFVTAHVKGAGRRSDKPRLQMQPK